MLLHGMNETCYVECTGLVSGPRRTYRSIPHWNRWDFGVVEADLSGFTSVEFCFIPLTVDFTPPASTDNAQSCRGYHSGWGDELWQ